MTEGYQVRYSPQAVEDLKDIYAYISQELHQRDTAAAQVSRIRAEIRSLDFLPLRYHCVDWEPWQSMGMRKAAAGKFLIFSSPIPKIRLLPLSAFFTPDGTLPIC